MDISGFDHFFLLFFKSKKLEKNEKKGRHRVREWVSAAVWTFLASAEQEVSTDRYLIAF